MSLRPRLAGNGRLRRPERVSILRTEQRRGSVGDIVGELYKEPEQDVFERTSEGLLLAEAFARFDFSRPRKAHQWYMTHGVLDLASLFPDDVPARTRKKTPTDSDPFHDTLDEVLEQQRNVRWHLLSLGRLSLARDEAEPPRTDWQPHEGWDPSWSQPALQGPDGIVLWLGAPADLVPYITVEMQRFARYEDAERRESPRKSDPEGTALLRRTQERWSQAHAAWQKIVAEDVPVLWVPRSGWEGHWAEYEILNTSGHGRRPWGRLSADWHGLLELQRRLMEPYVHKAAEHDIEIVRDGSWRRPPLGGGRNLEWGRPLLVNERRWWRSLLAPVYLQLLEGLRRISEGKAGAAFCRECGQPFLVLDARRSTYCNDRERFRYAQRQRRQRLASSTSERVAKR